MCLRPRIKLRNEKKPTSKLLKNLKLKNQNVLVLVLFLNFQRYILLQIVVESLVDNA